MKTTEQKNARWCFQLATINAAGALCFGIIGAAAVVTGSPGWAVACACGAAWCGMGLAVNYHDYRVWNRRAEDLIRRVRP